MTCWLHPLRLIGPEPPVLGGRWIRNLAWYPRSDCGQKLWCFKITEEYMGNTHEEEIKDILGNIFWRIQEQPWHGGMSSASGTWCGWTWPGKSMQKLEKTSTGRSLSLEWGLAPEKLIEILEPLLWGRSPDARNVVFRLLSWLFEPSTQVTSTLLRSLVGSLEVLELALDRLILVLEHITRLEMVTASVTVLSLLDRELKSQVILPTSEQWTSFP